MLEGDDDDNRHAASYKSNKSNMGVAMVPVLQMQLVNLIEAGP